MSERHSVNRDKESKFMKFSMIFLVSLFLAVPIFAYIDPGTGLRITSVLVAVVGGVQLLLLGFLWYPLKRMMQMREAVQQPKLGA